MTSPLPINPFQALPDWLRGVAANDNVAFRLRLVTAAEIAAASAEGGEAVAIAAETVETVATVAEVGAITSYATLLAPVATIFLAGDESPRMPKILPVVDQPPEGKPVSQWLDEMTEMATLALLMATKRNEATLYREYGLDPLARKAEQDLESLQIQVQTNIGVTPSLGNRLQIKASAAGEISASLEAQTAQSKSSDPADIALDAVPADAAMMLPFLGVELSVEMVGVALAALGVAKMIHWNRSQRALPPMVDLKTDFEVGIPQSLQEIARQQLAGLGQYHWLQRPIRIADKVLDLTSYARFSMPRWLSSAPVMLTPPAAVAIYSGYHVFTAAMTKDTPILAAGVLSVIVGGFAGFVALIPTMIGLGIQNEDRWNSRREWSVLKNVMDYRAAGRFDLARALVQTDQILSTSQTYNRHITIDNIASQAELSMDAGDYATTVKLLRPVIEMVSREKAETYDTQTRGTSSSRSRLYSLYSLALLHNGNFTEASRIFKQAANARLSEFQGLGGTDINHLADVAARRSAQFLIHITENDAQAIADPEIAKLVAHGKEKMQAKEYQAAEDLLLKASQLAENRYNHRADDIALSLLGLTVQSRDAAASVEARAHAEKALRQEEVALRDMLGQLIKYEKTAQKTDNNGLQFVVARAQLLLDHGRYLEAISALRVLVNEAGGWRPTHGGKQYTFFAHTSNLERAAIHQMLGVAELSAGQFENAQHSFGWAARCFAEEGAQDQVAAAKQLERTARYRLQGYVYYNEKVEVRPTPATLAQADLFAATHLERANHLVANGLYSRANREFAAAFDAYEALEDFEGMQESLNGQQGIAEMLGDATTAHQIARFKMTLKRPQ